MTGFELLALGTLLRKRANQTVYCFSRTTDWAGWLKVKEDLVYAIKKIVEEAGSSFAFPSRSLYVEMQTGGEP